MKLSIASKTSPSPKNHHHDEHFPVNDPNESFPVKAWLGVMVEKMTFVQNELRALTIERRRSKR
jgi:hypothetical protein